MNLSRKQTIAHLTLHGWQPFNIAMGGAISEGVVVYAYRTKSNGIDVAVQSVLGLNLFPEAVKLKTRDQWFMSNQYFWPIARKIMTAMENPK